MPESVRRGRFVTFEGGEGTGKSTQIRLLTAALDACGVATVTTREPGGAPAAEMLRGLLLDRAGPDWDPLSQTLLHHAARVEHLRHTILPALAAGRWVLSDRFADSTLAYQCYGQGVSHVLCEMLGHWVVGSTVPDLTIMLDLPVAEGLARLAGRGDGTTRYDAMAQAFHERVRAGYLEIARREPARCIVVDAAQSVPRVQAAIRASIEARLKLDLSGAPT